MLKYAGKYCNIYVLYYLKLEMRVGYEKFFSKLDYEHTCQFGSYYNNRDCDSSDIYWNQCVGCDKTNPRTNSSNALLGHTVIFFADRDFESDNRNCMPCEKIEATSFSSYFF